MELKVTLICGHSRLPSRRGICWNPLTRCLLVCDIDKSCVHAYAVSFGRDDTGKMKMLLNHNNPVGTIGSHGSGPGQFNYPVAAAVNLRGEVAVADGKSSRVQIFSGSGELEHSFGRPGSARGEFKGISDVKFTPRGHLAIVDSGNHRIQAVSATGNVVQVIGQHGWKLGQFVNPCALTVNGKGEYFVCDEGNKRIQRLSDRGRPLLEWGSRRGPIPEPEMTPFLATNDERQPVIYSVFDAPCDVETGLHGEIIVCDAGRRELLVFSDVGICLHVVSAPQIFQTNSPTAIAICSNMLVTMTKIKLDDQTGDNNNYMLAAFPPEKRVRVGRFETMPVHCAVDIACYLTYSDALYVRLVSRYFHQICRHLRNQWKLFPLTPGHSTITKYNRVVSPATGLIAVEEAFQKWGLRIYKPSNRIRKHVMDFHGGFCRALSTLYGSIFCYQYEDLLLAFFRFFTSSTSESSHEKEEIDRAAFIEIVTQIEEVHAEVRTWEQSVTSGEVPLPKSLQQIENAQQHQLKKLLQKFVTL
ncbi:uncharacterized protein PITG_13926 [Phytophthora infestans T30-4]|uniref:Uncharacterized protein n=1 Tax=Phytophthora infestans (strain T30-4) TaxID=403677 RepID=D0NN46_PHYIT|nr:uncharacterized protein PITG_13926 [Phytophthora infestans T30-4]EEY61953.1 conserved hypothetical protein [Phytophthora infestans T30-4]|eukprot:XP_002899593.1 conserved hypothetical protein [Phytophthora infestans T30-4]